MANTINTIAKPKSMFPDRPPAYTGIEEPDPEEVGPDPVEPTLSGIDVECDTAPLDSVIVTV